MHLSSVIYRIIIGVACCIIALHLFGPATTHAQTSARLSIESNDPRVIQGGQWSSQTVAQASGGSYLFSSGADKDVLALSFLGSAIEIIYITGPRLGTMAIEVDGTVLRTVITTADKTAYGQVATINYLTNEPHALKVYAQAGGIIAVDAFVIRPPTAPPSVLSSDGQATGATRTTTCAPLNAIQRVSVTSTGAQATLASNRGNVSADGRYVTIWSTASLIAGDGDGFYDGYVYDRQTCILQLVSVSSSGQKANADSMNPVISADGRYVAFSSSATNLVVGDTNGVDDVFVYDRQTATTSRVSVATGGVQSVGGHSSSPMISDDGRFVVFISSATNLVAGDTNAANDVFVYDRQTATTSRVSVATGGVQSVGSANSPTISGDGRFVAFTSAASDLVAGDTNGAFDVFVYDRQTTTTTRVSVASDGSQGVGGSSAVVPALSTDGRYVAFASFATNMVTGDINGFGDIFVRDRLMSQTIRVSVAAGGAQATGGHSLHPAISGDGRFVAYDSGATNLVTGDTNVQTDVFTYDRQTGRTTRVSVAADGTQAAGGSSSNPVLSKDGHYVAFNSLGVNLVMGDTNAVSDVFLSPSILTSADNLTLFQPSYKLVGLFDTLTDNPAAERFTAFSAYAPLSGGQWVMGDWNGDGLDTPGVYSGGAFFYTNKSGESSASDWRALWIGIAGPPVAGRFNANQPNDCIGAVQAGSFPPFGTAFVFYFTCDLSGNTAPAISFQWLSAVLPDSGGFTGVHQFGAGDFNADGVDSIAVRRGTYIAFGNVPPTTNSAAFDLAQFIGAPSANDPGIFVVGNWDGDPYDSFGLFYQNGELFFRNDLSFNSGAYGNQSVGTPFAGVVQAATWH